jgi:hypothetical protein
MARKRKAQPAVAVEAVEARSVTTLTYIGSVDEVGVCGFRLRRGVAAEVPEAVADRFASHPMFEVSRGNVHAD